MQIDWQKLAEEVAKSGHALLGPSALPRIMRCPGSVKASVLANPGNLKDDSSIFAEEGTNAHTLAELVLVAQQTNTEARAIDWLGTWIGEDLDAFQPDMEMVDSVQQYVDWCNELPGMHFTETRVPLNDRMPLKNQFGTTDHTAYYHRTLVVTDLKYGKGVQVFAEENEQAMAYALGMYDELSWAYEIDKVVIRICQPRLNHFDVWATTVERLLAFAKEMYDACLVAISDNPPTRAGEKQCGFCPVRGRCATQIAAVRSALANDFDSFDEPRPVELLTNDQIAEALVLAPLAKAWASHIQITAMKLLAVDATAVPNWKIVEATTRRAWSDKSRAEIWLQQQGLREGQVIERKVVSPAKAEKMLSKAQRAELRKINESKKPLIVKPPGKPALAPITDKRPVFTRVTADSFNEFEEEEDEEMEL